MLNNSFSFREMLPYVFYIGIKRNCLKKNFTIFSAKSSILLLRVKIFFQFFIFLPYRCNTTNLIWIKAVVFQKMSTHDARTLAGILPVQRKTQSNQSNMTHDDGPIKIRHIND